MKGAAPQPHTPLYLQALQKPWVLEQLKTLQSRLGHAWILAGPAGLNQFELALALAASWLCEQPHDHQPCGQCASCHMLNAHTHPDFKVLLPEETALALRWGEQDAPADEEGKKRKPSREIRIEALRNTIEFTQRTSAREKGQVIVIYPAERMNTASANTLLKTLEEPPGNTRFILASENFQRLLPTIRSRCLMHIMHWPNEKEALNWLEQNLVTHASTLLAAAGGRPELAYDMHTQGVDAGLWLQIPKKLQNGDPAVFDGILPAQMLDISIKFCHDLLVAASGGIPRFFSQESLPQGASVAALQAWSKELMHASRSADHPWNAPLYAQALAAKAATLFTNKCCKSIEKI